MTTSPSVAELLQTCENEKLHLSGAIQSFGALLCIDADGCITHASANLPDHVGVAPEAVLGQRLGELAWLPPFDLSRLGEKPGSALASPLSCHGKRLVANLIRAEQALVLEIEPNEGVALAVAVQEYQRPLLNAPTSESELDSHHHLLVEAIRAITGYDRVMLYRFREDWAGEVIAETVAEGMGHYLGLRFPASDIPAIARDLYLINPSRLIPAVAAASVPILSVDGQVPDLTYSDLRSVSPVHLQYLANMGVQASFSVPVRVTGRLWGLVACHRLRPGLVSPDQRGACISLVNAHAMGLTSYIASRRLQAIDSLDRRIDRLLQMIARHDDPLDGIASSGRELMEMLAADGFAMAVSDQVVISGEGPELDAMGIVDDWFQNHCEEWIASTNHLESLFPGELLLLAAVSGMMALKARSLRSGWVRFYWFRRQEPEEVAWAGNPNKPAEENAGATVLSPRRSFERWVEVRTGYSRPWTNEDRMTAAKFRNTLLRWL